MLVSVVIPTYNYRCHVVEAVESALAQTYQPIEVIVVDDGSSDDTKQELLPFRERIRYRYQQNQGTSAARNQGIRMAGGDYIAFLDADDVWEPTKIEKQVQVMEQSPRTGVVFCEFYRVNVQTGVTRHRQYPKELRGDIRRQLLQHCWVALSGALVRRSCFDVVGFLDETLRGVDDWDLWIRISRQFHFDYVPEPLFTYRVHGANYSGKIAAMYDSEIQVVQRAFREDPVYRRHFLLRRRTLSFLASETGKEYYWTGQHGLAASHLLRSIALWPFGRTPYAYLVRTLIRQTQWYRPEFQPRGKLKE